MTATLRKTLAALALLGIVAAGCSHRDQHSFASALTGIQLQGGSNDTTPKPPPNPPPKPPAPTIVFLSADTIQAGSSGATHWRLGNDLRRAVTMNWTLTSDAGWPGFPISGTQLIPALATRALDVTIPVPASALSGTYGLLMTVLTSAAGDTGSAISMATGSVRVFGNDGPPPPPPPPFPAVEFLGPDSLRIGAHNFLEWQLGNQSDHAFTMPWTAEGPPSWGFSFSGSISLGPLERQIVMVQFDVPDSAAAGSRWVQMTVTKPDGTPESVSSQVLLFP